MPFLSYQRVFKQLLFKKKKQKQKLFTREIIFVIIDSAKVAF